MKNKVRKSSAFLYLFFALLAAHPYYSISMNTLSFQNDSWLLVEKPPRKNSGWVLVVDDSPTLDDIIYFRQDTLITLNCWSQTAFEYLFEIKDNTIIFPNDEYSWKILEVSQTKLILVNEVGGKYCYVPLISTKKTGSKKIDDQSFVQFLMENTWEEEQVEDFDFGITVINRVLFLDFRLDIGTGPSEFYLMTQCYITNKYRVFPQDFGYDQIINGFLVYPFGDSLIIKFWDMGSGEKFNFQVLSVDDDSFTIGGNDTGGGKKFSVSF